MHVVHTGYRQVQYLLLQGVDDDVTCPVVGQPLPGRGLLEGAGVGEADSAAGQTLHHPAHG